MAGILIILAAALLVISIRIMDRMHRANEEREVTYPCTCGGTFTFRRFAGRSAVRQCTNCRNTLIRPAMHVCPNPSCNGSLLGECPQGAPDGEHYYDNRCCPRCGMKVRYYRPHSRRTQRALADLRASGMR